MDTITKTNTREYRKFTVTNPHRGAWFYTFENYEAYDSTYKGAMESIDRLYRQYDEAVATLAEMKAKPIASWDVTYYRLQRKAYTEAMDKVNTSYGINLSLTHHMGTHEEQLTKAQDFLTQRINYIHEAEKALHAIQLLGIDIADKERAQDYEESKWTNAEWTAKRFTFLAY